MVNNTTNSTVVAAKPKDLGQSPYWSKITVNNKGLIKISFSEKLAIVTNLTVFNDPLIMTVEVVAAQSEN